MSLHLANLKIDLEEIDTHISLLMKDTENISPLTISLYEQYKGDVDKSFNLTSRLGYCFTIERLQEILSRMNVKTTDKIKLKSNRSGSISMELHYTSEETVDDFRHRYIEVLKNRQDSIFAEIKEYSLYLELKSKYDSSGEN